MSALAAHARAMRVLGEALCDEGENSTDRLPNAELLQLMGSAHIAAAARLEAEIRLNAGRQDSGPVKLPPFTKGDGQ